MKINKNQTEKFVEELSKLYKKHNLMLRAFPKIVDGKIEADIHILKYEPPTKN